MTLFRVDWSKSFFSTYFWTHGTVYPFQSGLHSSSIGFNQMNARAMQVLNLISFLNIRGLTQCYQLFVVMLLLIDNTML